ncbi:hypothetical protein NB557_17410 [Vibrio alginolyticus]|uniref:hypothetical protein n=1 Tax=Vibrio TaxID=662 RepID=UPI00265B407F|nr:MULTISPECIES: hypothetical protein [Vibrio]MCE9845317.1 hypothetical protein [Vibrio antiquarius]MCR9675007.1 hypothetical protein [Vibrio alginolyticus]MDW1973573.1 hypothetical protein [Vibrio sp. Vb1980]
MFIITLINKGIFLNFSINTKLTVVGCACVISLFSSPLYSMSQKNTLTPSEAISLLQATNEHSPRFIELLFVSVNEKFEHENPELKRAVTSQQNRLAAPMNRNASASALPYQVDSEIKRDVCVITFDKSKAMDDLDFDMTLRHELGHCYQNYLIDRKSDYGKLVGIENPTLLSTNSNNFRSEWNKYNQEAFAELTTATLEYKKYRNFKWLDSRLNDYQYKYNLPVYSFAEPLLKEYKGFVKSKIAVSPTYFDDTSTFEAIEDVYNDYFLHHALSELDFEKQCADRKTEMADKALVKCN